LIVKDSSYFRAMLPRLALRRTGYGSGCDMLAATKLSAHPKVIASSSNSQCNRGKTPGKRKVLIQWIKPRS
jgi:hypothetical protein